MIPTIKQYGIMEIERLNQLIFTHSYFTDQSQYKELVIIERNENGEIQLIDFDMVKINEVSTAMAMDIENTYGAIEEGRYIAKDTTYYERRLASISDTGIIASIPMTTMLNFPYLGFVSPKVNIAYKHLASVSNRIVKSVENYGVNHVMIELSIEIHLQIAMVYPLFEEIHQQVIKVPILLEIFQGQVPSVYFAS